MQGTLVQFLGWEDPLEEGMANPLQYSCLENPHRQRSLADYSPLGSKESEMTGQLGTHKPQSRLPVETNLQQFKELDQSHPQSSHLKHN